MEIARIFMPIANAGNLYPNYDNQLSTRYVFVEDNYKDAYLAHENGILDTVVTKITEFVNDPDRCNNSEGMFPQPKFLTGEWYLSEVLIDEESTLTISCRFLGTDTGVKTDYLKLEVSFFFDEEFNQFLFEEVNSEAL